MAADFNKPVITDAYASVLQSIRDLAKDLALCLDNTGTQNIPTNAIRWSSANSRFEKYNGSAWAALTGQYAIDVATVGGKTVGNASGNVPLSNGTLNTNLNAQMVGGAQVSSIVNYLGSVDNSALNTATGNGFYTVGYSGYSSGLLAFNTQGSAGNIQMEFFYSGNLRYRNRTDQSTWTGWKTVYTDANFTPNATSQNNIGVAGSYGAVTLLNNVGSWAGLRFGTGVGSDNRYLMTNGGQTGEYDSGAGAWQWRWDNGTLAYGTVPWARLSGVPAFNYLALTGGTMTGAIMSVTNTAAFSSANETTFSVRGSTTAPAAMSFHRQSAYAVNMGLDTDNLFKIGGWSAGIVSQLNMSGQLWLANYGWLHDYFFSTVANCAAGYGMGTTVVSNCGDLVIGSRMELVDEGGQLRLRTNEWRGNCNCNCNCNCK